MQLKTSMLGALALESVIGQQGGKAGELKILFSALEKMDAVRAARKAYVKRLPNGAVDVDEAALELADDFAADFDKAEIEKMAEVLDSWQAFQTRDLKWLLPLRRELRDMLEGERQPAKKLTRAV